MLRLMVARGCPRGHDGLSGTVQSPRLTPYSQEAHASGHQGLPGSVPRPTPGDCRRHCAKPRKRSSRRRSARAREY
jgi:hypothetical protein